MRQEQHFAVPSYAPYRIGDRDQIILLTCDPLRLCRVSAAPMCEQFVWSDKVKTSFTKF